MRYVFDQLPERVSFLYGSLFAVRREIARMYGSRVGTADDTDFGQTLAAQGHEIRFAKELEVVHLKRYSFWGWVKNDFQIACDWAMIFVQRRSWRRLWQGSHGFAHASRAQLLSVLLAPVIAGLCVVWFGTAENFSGWFVCGLAGLWLWLNRKFFMFLSRCRRGRFSFLKAVPITFLDHLIMAAGSGWGMMREMAQELLRGVLKKTGDKREMPI